MFRLIGDLTAVAFSEMDGLVVALRKAMLVLRCKILTAHKAEKQC
jgi:hypothetical protein